MDESIRAADPAHFRARGAQAFDEGLGINDHDMNPWVPAVDDWQKGWRDRRAAVHARELVKFCVGEVSPP